MKETFTKGSNIAFFFIVLLGNYVAFAATYDKFGVSHSSFYIYISILAVILSEVLILCAGMYFKREADVQTIVCMTLSSVFFALANVLAEYGVIKVGAFYERYLPRFSMFLGLAPSLYALALADRLHKRRTESHSKILIFACFILSLPAFAIAFFLIFNYVWMCFVANNTNIYATLAIVYFVMIIIGMLATLLSSEKGWFYSFASLAIFSLFLMNIIAYDKGSIVLRIVNGEFLSWWTRLTPYYYIEGFMFASLGSYSIVYIILLMNFWRGFTPD